MKAYILRDCLVQIIVGVLKKRLHYFVPWRVAWGVGSLIYWEWYVFLHIFKQKALKFISTLEHPTGAPTILPRR